MHCDRFVAYFCDDALFVEYMWVGSRVDGDSWPGVGAEEAGTTVCRYNFCSCIDVDIDIRQAGFGFVGQ